MKRLAAREISLEGQPGAFAGSLMNSSADLVSRACRGDQEAFRLIFERYSRPVISFIYDQVSDRELAEELTQETFVRAYRSLKTRQAAPPTPRQRLEAHSSRARSYPGSAAPAEIPAAHLKRPFGPSRRAPET